MKNNEKANLRFDVKELSKKGYSKKEGVKILMEYGYVKSTALRYWNVFAFAQQKEQK